MAKVIYSMLTSLDGYIEDERGSIDWTAPDDELFYAQQNARVALNAERYYRMTYQTPEATALAQRIIAMMPDAAIARPLSLMMCGCPTPASSQS